MKPLSQPKPNRRDAKNSAATSQARAKLFADVDTMMRDLAFVLKMTQQVRQEIEVGKEKETFAMA